MSGTEKLLCRCYLVPERTVREAIREKGLRTLEEVAAATHASMGCGSCFVEIEEILDKVWGRSPTKRRQARTRNAERRAQALDVVLGLASRLLELNGIQVHVLDVEGNRVLARLCFGEGRSTHQPSALALKRFLVDLWSRRCGERMALVELNVLEAWGEPS